MATKKTDDFTKPANDFIKYLGLDYRAPKTATECVKGLSGVIPTIRSGVKRLFSLADKK